MSIAGICASGACATRNAFAKPGRNSRAGAVLALLIGGLPALGGVNAQAQRDSATVARRTADSLRLARQPHASAQFDVASHIADLPAVTLSQLLTGRFTGVQVVSTGATGTGSRIRIRGQTSLYLGNDPLVVLDGIRVYRAPSNVSAPAPSRLDDINPDEIDTIEILGGPSASALYGTGAANGVISITTKRGAAGKTRVKAYAEGGLIADRGNYPDLWSLWGKRTGSTVSNICNLQLVSARNCTVDSLSHGNVMKIDSLKPTDLGYRSQYGVQISGGRKRVQFFASGEREEETGVFRMPDFDVDRLKAERGVNSLPSAQIRPSALARNSFRINVGVQPVDWFTLDLTSAYVDGTTRLVASDDNGSGIGASATGGSWNLGLRNNAGEPLRGYGFYLPGDIMSQSTTQDVERTLLGLKAELKPTRWLTARGAVGFDDASVLDRFVIRRNEGPEGNSRSGLVSEGTSDFSLLTFDGSIAGAFAPTPWVNAQTTVGAQRIRTKSAVETITATDLPVSTDRVADAVGSRSSIGLYDKATTVGVYVEEQLSFGKKVFVNGGVRRDTPTWLGIKYEALIYPSVSASWLLSGHEFFPVSNRLSLVRLRAAYGKSGRHPKFDESLPIIPFAGSNIGTATPDGQPSYPEISAEFDGGVDATFLNERSQVALTYYKTKTKRLYNGLDGIPSGYSSTTDPSGIEVENAGFEVTFNQRILDGRNAVASVSISGMTNRNRLTALSPTFAPVFTGNRSTQRNTPGYGLFGLWGRTYTYADANSDGIITGSEMTFSDTAQYIAPSVPTRALSLAPTVELFNKKVRLSALIDSKWGFRKFNNTLRHQCQQPASCQARNDRTSSLEDQAAALAITQAGVLTGMFEDASFTRFREASVSYELPVRWANSFRAAGWSVALTGRNLGIITNYSGTDPEAISSTADDRSDEYFSTPLMRYFTLRFNLRF